MPIVNAHTIWQTLSMHLHGNLQQRIQQMLAFSFTFAGCIGVLSLMGLAHASALPPDGHAKLHSGRTSAPHVSNPVDAPAPGTVAPSAESPAVNPPAAENSAPEAVAPENAPGSQAAAAEDTPPSETTDESPGRLGGVKNTLKGFLQPFSPQPGMVVPVTGPPKPVVLTQQVFPFPQRVDAPGEGAAGMILWGLMTAQGKVVLPPKYTAIVTDAPDSFRLQLGNRWGLANGKGEVIVPPWYAHLGAFVDGLAPAQFKANGMWGYIDATGRFVIDPQLSAAQSFSAAQTQRAWVSVPGDGWQLITPSGEVVFRLSPHFNITALTPVTWLTVKNPKAAGTREDPTLQTLRVARVKNRGGFWGLLTESGDWRITPQFLNLTPFHEQWAIAQSAEPTTRGLWGVIDTAGHWVVSPQWANAKAFSPEGLAPASLDGTSWGMVNRKGAWVTPPQFEALGISSDNSDMADVFAPQDNNGLLPAKLAGLWGFVSKQGQWRIAPQYTQVAGFSSGLALVKSSQGWQHITARNSVVMPHVLPDTAVSPEPIEPPPPLPPFLSDTEPHGAVSP